MPDVLIKASPAHSRSRKAFQVSRSNKANLPWVDAVGERIVEALVDRHRRPMIYLQSGPYQNNPPFVGIYFNDPILHYVKSSKADHTADFRFGFYIRRWYSNDRRGYTQLSRSKCPENPQLYLSLVCASCLCSRSFTWIFSASRLRRYNEAFLPALVGVPPWTRPWN